MGALQVVTIFLRLLLQSRAALVAENLALRQLTGEVDVLESVFAEEAVKWNQAQNTLRDGKRLLGSPFRMDQIPSVVVQDARVAGTKYSGP
jgi:hypothetical protein